MNKLILNKIDATLLNPPFSYNNIGHIIKISDVIGAYKSIVANVNKTWLNSSDNKILLLDFIQVYSQTIKLIFDNPEIITFDLSKFYNLPDAIAVDIYKRLAGQDGLNNCTVFDHDALSGTEKLFNWSTKVRVPENRTWVTYLA